MLRRWFVLFLLALQLLPALALVPGQADALTLEIDHALVHQSGQGHDHDDTLASHFDDDDAPLPHAHHDTGHHSALPLAIPDLRLPTAEPSAHLSPLTGRLPDPHLEGPLRPPRPAV